MRFKIGIKKATPTSIMANFRAIAPEIHQIEQFPLMKHTFFTLDNGLRAYALREGTEEVVSIQFIFKAGKFYADNFLLPEFVAKTITDGTVRLDSESISEKLAFHAASFSAAVGSDFFSADLTCLNKHLPDLLPLTADFFREAIFPEKEFELFRERAIQAQKVSFEKVNYLALNIFREKLFGKEHPYGFRIEDISQLKDISRDEVKKFYEGHIADAPCDIFIAGRFDEKAVSLLNKHFGKTEPKQITAAKGIKLPAFRPETLYVEKENANQTCIRTGFPAISPQNEDYFAYMMLNEILGGYFGSRLMKNIREEKGLTYGIYSNLSVLRHASMFSVQAEVNKDNAKEALAEIFKEMQILTEEKVGEEELRIVKNSVTGGYIGSLTTPFEVMEKIKTQVLNDFPDDFYDKFIDKISEVSSEKILATAQKYFTQEKLTVMVG